MFLELTEVLVCPRCRPAQGLIALVEEIDERRVRRGALGCPECEARYPVGEGLVRFVEPDEGEDAPATGSGNAALLAEVDVEEGATRIAALLAAPEAGDPLLLGPGLGRYAPALAAMTEGVEVVVLAPAAADPVPAGEGAPGGGVTRLAGADPRDLPMISGRMGGAAFIDPGQRALEEGARVLRRGARLVLLDAGPAAREAMPELPLEVVADDPRATVAVRRT